MRRNFPGQKEKRETQRRRHSRLKTTHAKLGRKKQKGYVCVCHCKHLIWLKHKIQENEKIQAAETDKHQITKHLLCHIKKLEFYSIGKKS